MTPASAIVLPGLVTGDDPTAAERYITAGWALLDEQACGWIVDLRGNGGGNLFPMLVAIAPLLGPGPTVGYRRRDGTTDVYRLNTHGDLITPPGWRRHAAPSCRGDAGRARRVRQGLSTFGAHVRRAEAALRAMMSAAKSGT